jgi:hypothetical protein
MRIYHFYLQDKCEKALFFVHLKMCQEKILTIIYFNILEKVTF